MLLNKKGLTMVEVLIAVFLTAIAVISLMPMQDTSIKSAFRADYLGRAEGILQSELELRESQIMNSANTVTTGTVTKSVNVSGTSRIDGDATFTVVTTTSVYGSTTNSWIVNAKVTWTGNTTGITSSIIATRQTAFD